MSDILPCRFCGNRPFLFEDDDYMTIGCQGHDCSPRPCVEGLRVSDVKASWNVIMAPLNAELLEACERLLGAYSRRYDEDFDLAIVDFRASVERAKESR